MRTRIIISLLIIAAFSVTILGNRLSYRKGDTSMGIISIAAYKPRPGKEQMLLELTREHVIILRAQGLATDRAPYAMRAADGTIVEVFEWKSKEAIDSAHANPAVMAMWKRYGEACEYTPLAKIKECSDMFAGFEPIDLQEK